jgi:hypothetical protein
MGYNPTAEGRPLEDKLNLSFVSFTAPRRHPSNVAQTSPTMRLPVVSPFWHTRAALLCVSDTMATYVKNPRIIERHIRGEHILVPLADTDKALDSLYVLNRTAALIWQHAAEGLNTTEIVHKVRQTFDVDDSMATDDVNRVISELVSIGALLPTSGRP